MSRREAEALVRRSVTLAREVRDELAGDGRRRLVAASVGPYGAVLADGSEYRGRYGLTRRPSCATSTCPGSSCWPRPEPDLLAVETIPDARRGGRAGRAARRARACRPGCPTPCDGPATRAGQPLAEAFAVAAVQHGGGRDRRELLRARTTCCPRSRSRARSPGKPGVAYPNSGQGWDSGTHTWSGTSAYDVTLAPSWVAAGRRTSEAAARSDPPTSRPWPRCWLSRSRNSGPAGRATARSRESGCREDGVVALHVLGDEARPAGVPDSARPARS